MKKSRRTYNGVHLNKKSNTQDVVEQSLTEYLSYLELKSEEHKRHYISEIASLVIELPSKEKQNRIAYLMTSLDNKLALEENTRARYMDEKRYLLSQMFI